jgi:hypothetical protein
MADVKKRLGGPNSRQEDKKPQVVIPAVHRIVDEQVQRSAAPVSFPPSASER